MAEKRIHPWRTILVFLLAIAFMWVGMALLHAWTPKLGLDLRGGTTITLTSTNKGAVDKNSLELARTIIQRRVDSLGVGETSVAIQGDRQILISVPNVQQDQLVRLVGQTAQLTFRQVLFAAPSQEQKPTPSPSASGKPEVGLPTAPPPPTPTPSITASPSAGATTPAQAGDAKDGISSKQIDERLGQQADPQDQQALMKIKCGDKPTEAPDKVLMTCDKDSQYKYLLGPVVLEGKDLKDAQAGVPQNQLNWQVNLSFNEKGTRDFGQITKNLVAQPEPRNQFAIVIDGKVQSAPRIQSEIPGGSAEITGQFNQQTASDLANVLKFGALPVAFEVSSVDNVSATLGEDQLRAGIIAGIIGLALVVLYALLYYRGLSIVVVASLAIAGLTTYAMLVLLGQSMDLALNLPGIAGAIVAIGVTADSFIIYFERIRDEVREGRSLRTAIETGWRKARPTIVVADMVSMLSAVVLFLLAMGAVKGFAFTLGLTTLIDLAIVFFFTHPLMTLLGRTKFFGEGHKFSGLEASHMGVEGRPVAVAASAVQRRKAPPPRSAKPRSAHPATESTTTTSKEA